MQFIRALIGLAIMVYEPLYHALQIWKLYASAQNEKQDKSRLFFNKLRKNSLNLWAYLTL